MPDREEMEELTRQYSEWMQKHMPTVLIYVAELEPHVRPLGVDIVPTLRETIDKAWPQW